MFSYLGKLLTSGLFNNPLLVVGLGRSGTTVLLQALGKHPEILSIKAESPLIYHIGALVFGYELSGYNDWHERSLHFPLNDLNNRLRRLTFESVYGSNYGLAEILKRQARMDLSIIQKKFWCARTYPQEHEAKGILKLFPNAKFVYIHRNGCDVVHSRTRYRSFRELPFSEHCETWANHIYKYLYLLHFKQAVVLSHKELTSDPATAFARIYTLMGAKQNVGPAHYVESTMVHPLNESTKKRIAVGQVFEQRPPAYAGWSSEQKETFKIVCGDAMGKMGYEMPF
jgi:hypothetical protein